jgi:hypothetical protein
VSGPGPSSGLGGRIVCLLEAHHSVRRAELVGSRAAGRASVHSDWDFWITCDNFAALASELPQLFAPLHPLAQQWSRFGRYRCWMLVLPGPVRIELMFPAEGQDPPGPRQPSADNLAAMDAQFWDWVLRANGKQAVGGNTEAVIELELIFEDLLSQLGVQAKPRSLAEAVECYRLARDAAEASFGIRVPRHLETEVAKQLS